MSKSSPLAANGHAKQAVLPPLRQVLVQRRQQPGILAAQVEQALLGTDGESGNAHAIEDEVGMARQQHAILEGAGLSLVGVADDVAAALQVPAGRAACRFPLRVRRETGAAAPAQIGQLHLVEQPFASACNCRPHRLAGRPAGCQQNIPAPDVVGDEKPVARPVGHRHL
jgi:hypothetical protein